MELEEKIHQNMKQQLNVAVINQTWFNGERVEMKNKNKVNLSCGEIFTLYSLTTFQPNTINNINIFRFLTK